MPQVTVDWNKTIYAAENVKLHDWTIGTVMFIENNQPIKKDWEYGEYIIAGTFIYNGLEKMATLRESVSWGKYIMATIEKWEVAVFLRKKESLTAKYLSKSKDKKEEALFEATIKYKEADKTDDVDQDLPF